MKIQLNNNWHFLQDYNEEYLTHTPFLTQNIDLPHCIQKVELNNNHDQDFQKVTTYIKEFDYKNETENKHIFLDFEGFMLQADIYLNDIKLGHFISGFLPVLIDVTNQIKRHNRLVVVLDSKEDPNIPPFGDVVDYYTFGGIYRDVYLVIKDDVYISNYFVNADMNGNIKINLNVNNPAKLEYITKIILKDNAGSTIKESRSAEFCVSNPHLWSTDDPYLYFLTISIEGSFFKDEITTKVGFKTAMFKKDGFYLNNNKIKLIGLNRHQAYPYVGYAAPRLLQEDDANILKYTLGVNVVRTSHYSQSEYFLSHCDEIGLLFIDEVPGWQHLDNNQIWQDNLLDFINRMVLKERNHTSLIAYGVRVDESNDNHDLYTKCNCIAHMLDPIHQTLGVRNFKKSELLEDIYAYNDFSCNSLSLGLLNPSKVTSNINKPYIVSEHNGHMYPVKPGDSSLIKLNQCLRHAKVISDAFKYCNISGAIGWCFVDYYTHSNFGGGDNICYHGILDINRNPKPVSNVYKMESNIEVPYLEPLNTFLSGDNPASLQGLTYIATNCDYIKLYKGSSYISTFNKDLKYNKPFKNLPNKFIVIDDFIGARFKQDSFSKSMGNQIIRLLNKVFMFGQDSLNIIDKLEILMICITHHMNFNKLFSLYSKYIYMWGGNNDPFILEGYKDGKLVISKKYGQSTKDDLEIKTPYKEVKEIDSHYEIIPIEVKYVDEFNNVLPYTIANLKIEVKGPCELISDSMLPLIGGAQRILIKTIHKYGIVTVKVSCKAIEKNIQINILKD